MTPRQEPAAPRLHRSDRRARRPPVLVVHDLSLPGVHLRCRSACRTDAGSRTDPVDQDRPNRVSSRATTRSCRPTSPFRCRRWRSSPGGLARARALGRGRRNRGACRMALSVDCLVNRAHRHGHRCRRLRRHDLLRSVPRSELLVDRVGDTDRDRNAARNWSSPGGRSLVVGRGHAISSVTGSASSSTATPLVLQP